MPLTHSIINPVCTLTSSSRRWHYSSEMDAFWVLWCLLLFVWILRVKMCEMSGIQFTVCNYISVSKLFSKHKAPCLGVNLAWRLQSYSSTLTWQAKYRCDKLRDFNKSTFTTMQCIISCCTAAQASACRARWNNRPKHFIVRVRLINHMPDTKGFRCELYNRQRVTSAGQSKK